MPYKTTNLVRLLLLPYYIARFYCHPAKSRMMIAILPAVCIRLTTTPRPAGATLKTGTALKAQVARENSTAKGHAYDAIKAGESYVLLETDGPGIINRMWVTINDRSPEMLPAHCESWICTGMAKTNRPFQFCLSEIFGVGLGKTTVFQNALFASPEGRSLFP